MAATISLATGSTQANCEADHQMERVNNSRKQTKRGKANLDFRNASTYNWEALSSSFKRSQLPLCVLTHCSPGDRQSWPMNGMASDALSTGAFGSCISSEYRLKHLRSSFSDDEHWRMEKEKLEEFRDFQVNCNQVQASEKVEVALGCVNAFHGGWIFQIQFGDEWSAFVGRLGGSISRPKRLRKEAKTRVTPGRLRKRKTCNAH